MIIKHLDTVIQKINQKSCLRKTEDILSHLRSGKVQGFRNKIEEKTIKSINKKLQIIFSLF
jgi:hypothetical protein